MDWNNIIIKLLNIVLMIGITLGYGLSAYWNIRYLILAKNKNSFCWIKMHFAIASTLMVFIYLYLFYELVLGNPPLISVFSNVVIRPVICYLGFMLASAARSRYLSLRNQED